MRVRHLLLWIDQHHKINRRVLHQRPFSSSTSVKTFRFRLGEAMVAIAFLAVYFFGITLEEGSLWLRWPWSPQPFSCQPIRFLADVATLFRGQLELAAVTRRHWCRPHWWLISGTRR